MSSSQKLVVTYIAICCGIVAVSLAILLAVSVRFPGEEISAIRKRAKTNSEFTLGETTTFDWDVAYNNMDGYTDGQWLRDKYGLVFEPLDFLGTEIVGRLLFFKDGQLVKLVEYRIEDLTFEDTDVEIKPDTKFSVEWRNYERWHKTLILNAHTS